MIICKLFVYLLCNILYMVKCCLIRCFYIDPLTKKTDQSTIIIFARFSENIGNLITSIHINELHFFLLNEVKSCVDVLASIVERRILSLTLIMILIAENMWCLLWKSFDMERAAGRVHS